MPSCPVVHEPALLLDVDGVVSPLGPGPAQFWGDWEQFAGMPYETPVSRRMLAAVSALPARRLWLTTWEGEARMLFSELMGGEDIAVLRRRGPEGPRANTGWWKLDAALGWLTTVGTRPVVWADDELGEHRSLVRRHLNAVGVPALLVSPDRNVGLRPQDIDNIRQWLTARAWEEPAPATPRRRRRS